jgi:hypothetical protein
LDLVFSTLSFHHWTDQLGGLRQVVLRRLFCVVYATIDD